MALQSRLVRVEISFSGCSCIITSSTLKLRRAPLLTGKGTLIDRLGFSFPIQLTVRETQPLHERISPLTAQVFISCLSSPIGLTVMSGWYLLTWSLVSNKALTTKPFRLQWLRTFFPMTLAQHSLLLLDKSWEGALDVWFVRLWFSITLFCVWVLALTTFWLSDSPVWHLSG